MTPVIHDFRPIQALAFPAQTLPRSPDKAQGWGGMAADGLELTVLHGQWC